MGIITNIFMKPPCFEISTAYTPIPFIYYFISNHTFIICFQTQSPEKFQNSSFPREFKELNYVQNPMPEFNLLTTKAPSTIYVLYASIFSHKESFRMRLKYRSVINTHKILISLI